MMSRLCFRYYLCRQRHRQNGGIMKKIRVLHFPLSNQKGGRTQYAIRTWKYIDHDAFQIDFGTVEENFELEETLTNSGARVYHVNKYAEEDFDSFEQQFRYMLRDGRYDILHLHTSRWKSFSAENIAREENIARIIIHAHFSGYKGELTEDQKIIRDLHLDVRSKLTPEIATDFWACSNEAADWVFGDRIPKNQIVIMNNAIDINKYKVDMLQRRMIRNQYGLLPDDFVIGTVGRLVKVKNIDFLIRLMVKMRQRNQHIKLLIRASGEKKQEYLNLIESLALEDSVIFVGYIEEIEKIYSVFDVFCLPSTGEGLPVVVVEAQAAGLPCIVSDMVGVESKLSSVLQFCPLDEDLWIEKIYELYLARGKRKDTSYEIKKAGYDINTQIKKIEKGYRGEL